MSKEKNEKRFDVYDSILEKSKIPWFNYNHRLLQ